MEYKLILAGPVNKRTVENAVIDWVRRHPQGVMATSGSRGLPSAGMPVPQNRQKVAPAHSPALAPQRTQPRVYGAPAPAGLEQALSSHIRLRRVSEMGKNQVHTFIYNERELLIVRQGSMHHQWVQLRHSWETTQGLQAVQAVQPKPANLSEWDRLKLAMASGIRQLPGQVVETVQKIIDSLLTWQGMLLIVAVTAIFVLGGEIALILMGAVAVYDLLMNVLPLLVEFYHKAIAAKDQTEIDAAGKLFAQAILRGGLDVIDILFAGGAVRRLTVLGGGRITARAVWVYIEERIGLLVARLQKGAGKLQQVMRKAQDAAKGKRSYTGRGIPYKKGWSKERVLGISKPKRPSPNEYLPQEYIDAHLAKFDKGGSYLVPKEALDRFGRNPVGRPDGQFVMSKTEMDALLKRANGDMSVIEKELGIPEGLWKGKEMVRIDIPDPNSINLRMPNGNEGGANELWLPGGKLPTGYSEAVVNSIPAGKYKEIIIKLN